MPVYLGATDCNQAHPPTSLPSPFLHTRPQPQNQSRSQSQSWTKHEGTFLRPRNQPTQTRGSPLKQRGELQRLCTKAAHVRSTATTRINDTRVTDRPTDGVLLGVFGRAADNFLSCFSAVWKTQQKKNGNIQTRAHRNALREKKAITICRLLRLPPKPVGWRFRYRQRQGGSPFHIAQRANIARGFVHLHLRLRISRRGNKSVKGGRTLGKNVV